MTSEQLRALAAGACVGDSKAAPTVVEVRTQPSETKGGMCATPTTSTTVDTKNLVPVNNEVFTDTITNGTPAIQTMIIGTELGREGANTFFGQPASAVDQPLMSDKNGANLQALQGFAILTSNHSDIVDVIEIVAPAAAAIRSAPLRYFEFDENGDICSKRGAIPYSSSFDNLTQYKGPFAFTDRKGMSLDVPTLAEFSLNLYIGNRATAENFN
jgi:hypothetical protein